MNSTTPYVSHTFTVDFDWWYYVTKKINGTTYFLKEFTTTPTRKAVWVTNKGNAIKFHSNEGATQTAINLKDPGCAAICSRG